MFIVSTKKLVAQLKDIATLPQEHLICFTLNSADQIIRRHEVFKGGLSSVDAHPREIYAAAICDHASKIVIAHNHPYGGVKPSPGDIETTQRLFSVGRIVGIPLIDHVIVSGKKHFSFSEHGYIDDQFGELLKEYLT